ncbi:alpha/beta fold hydrolase [Microtetraspora niveoalba]|uniref:alpha/beta fold hydrolase n=1 Tax=Microtetraspora niveoalba TaxID=46175 RepID=UPI000A913099|nr:alpha/beta hydrolase [Microtetraspora niveoalba]
MKTPDGRVLAVEEWGVPDGIPVLYTHGTPMSRLARYPDDSLFTEMGVRLVTYDRPGFGASSPRSGRRVHDAADDIATIADELGIDRFPLFGVSGGGPHALAFAARFPERVTRVATLAGPAPCDAGGLDWTAGMMEANRKTSVAALRGREALVAHFAEEDAESESPATLMPAAEQAVLARPEVKRMLAAAFAEAVRPGTDGWIDDELALYGLPWGFDPAGITVPVRIWHGTRDTVIPVSHARWLAARIPAATLIEDGEAGHAGHFAATPAMLRWLVTGD